MPIFILAGGLGTRISEESELKPKPMIEIGGIPILVHIMRHYYAFGFDDFIICAGYRSLQIKKFFGDYALHLNDVEVDQRKGSRSRGLRVIGRTPEQEQWRVRVLETGLHSMTGARLAQAIDKIQSIEPFEHFGMTYGDGLCNVNLRDELNFHLSHGQVGTVLGVKNHARFGEIDVTDECRVSGFLEKPQSRQGYISGGFFFFTKAFRNYLSQENETVLEREPLVRLASDGQLCIYKHSDFWYSMDTLRDKLHLQELWDSGSAPWLKYCSRGQCLKEAA
ncbi:MAG: NTP transferase domain-containing protein [Deltaproteobacteria bacterium]|nr:NTP transferase domain-containing protein [Deltaproteobacteria bacterium]